MRFVAPDMASGDRQSISSVVVPRGSAAFSSEELKGLPDTLVRAMADTLDAAAAEMEVCEQTVK